MTDEQRAPRLRTRTLVEQGDHLELSVRYKLINGGSDFVVSRVHWQWRGRCNKNGSAPNIHQAEAEAVRALDDWSRG